MPWDEDVGPFQENGCLDESHGDAETHRYIDVILPNVSNPLNDGFV